MPKKLGVDYQYVILDDDSDMLYTQRFNFIQTDSEIGLMMWEATKAVEILNQKTQEQ